MTDKVKITEAERLILEETGMAMGDRQTAAIESLVESRVQGLVETVQELIARVQELTADYEAARTVAENEREAYSHLYKNHPAIVERDALQSRLDALRGQAQEELERHRQVGIELQASLDTANDHADELAKKHLDQLFEQSVVHDRSKKKLQSRVDRALALADEWEELSRAYRSDDPLSVMCAGHANQLRAVLIQKVECGDHPAPCNHEPAHVREDNR
jgi:DNA repair exonuclease SbcCD ATPase subunit